MTDTASRLREQHQARAFRDVGLSLADARRLAEEHGRLRAHAQRAGEILDVDERRRLMAAIAAAYGRLYLGAPDRLIWTGFAAIAVNDGVAPTTAVAALAARCCTPEGIVATVLRALGDGRADVTWALAEGGLKASFEANYAIFADLYWVHLAYRDGGLDALRTLHEGGALDRALLDGFTLIDEGDVIQGNLLLFRREQHATVTPVFAKYREAIAAATQLGLVSVPNALLQESCAEMGRSPVFPDDEESYGPFSGRWRWLTACTWEPLVRLHEDRAPGGGRAKMEAEVRRAIAGRSEAFGPLARRAIRHLAARLGGGEAEHALIAGSERA